MQFFAIEFSCNYQLGTYDIHYNYRTLLQRLFCDLNVLSKSIGIPISVVVLVEFQKFRRVSDLFIWRVSTVGPLGLNSLTF